MSLDRYRDLRDFKRTPEPAPGPVRGGSGRFVVHRHRATRLHYDLRLEVNGVLASWAVPRGPTLDPDVRRLAQRTEDHPIEYLGFEGRIPAGGYGAGDSIAWDWGRYEPEETDDPAAALLAGELKFSLYGEKLRGRFTLVHTGGRGGRGGRRDDQASWLLLHKRDEHAVPGWDPEAHPRSVRSGLTNEELAAGASPRFSVEPPEAEATVDLAGLPAVRQPAFVAPMLATPVDAPFTDMDWLFEVKWDGYRVEAVVSGGVARLWTRNRTDAASYVPELSGVADWISAHDAIVDGELVALDEEGRPSFSRLQERSGHLGLGARRGERRPAASRSGEGSAIPVVYWAFDLLHADGHSLMDLPLESRKSLLRRLLRPHAVVRYAPHVLGDGEAYLAAIREQGLEGMVGKRRASRYEPGRRSEAWVKLKLTSEQELVVVGWVPRTGSTTDIGSLITAVYEPAGALRLAGQVGSGLDRRSRDELAALLGPLARQDPAVEVPSRSAEARWVEPRVVIRARFAEWTPDGLLRQPVYLGVDRGREARDVHREEPMAASRVLGYPLSAVRGAPAGGRATEETPRDPATVSPGELAALDRIDGEGEWEIAGRTVRLTNLDKVLFPGDPARGIVPATKRDLIRHYALAAAQLLPLLADRGVSVRRFPDGVSREGFWQKDLPGHTPSWVGRWTYRHHAEGPKTYPVVSEPATLAWLAQEAAVELHPWTSPTATPEQPSYALIDIDPGTDTSWEETLVLARLFRVALEHLGIVGLPKLTGGRGIHVWVPIRPGYTFDDTREWVERLSRAVGSSAPDLVSWEWSKRARRGRARLDFTQNALNRTLAAPYSVRAAPNAPVSAPIRWEELGDPSLVPDRWTIRDIPARLRTVGDLYASARSLAQELPPL
jgi:bifunctional non-homologous end joining protein LigD